MHRVADVRDRAAVEAFVNQAAIALQHRLDINELDRHRVHLEELVAERTRALSAAQGQLVLQEKLATVGRVAGSVAHELRNPLGAIRNASYYLQMTAAPRLEGKQLRHLQVIDEYVDRANQAISMILDFTQGRRSEPVLCALPSILQRAVTDASLPPNVEVLIAIPPRLPEVLADDGQIVVVFRNLLTNAGRAMPGSGVVKIQARAGQDEVIVDVTDTGTGIKPEHMARLFQPLFTTGEIGIGLGLAICQGFVRANKGTISVVSELGKGTTFTVTLPTAEGQITSSKSQITNKSQ
jgi:signal transduction histidine kinase